MAYMEDGKGPYPNKAGEYCGNHHPDSMESISDVHSIGDSRKEHLAKMRLGRPHACMGETSKQWAQKGWVGLYLKEDNPAFGYIEQVPTPTELMEPPS